MNKSNKEVFDNFLLYFQKVRSITLKNQKEKGNLL